MPFYVRLKIFMVLALNLFAIVYLFSLVWWAGAAGLLLSILYLEMIYPRLNFFGAATQSVRNRGSNAVAITFDDGPSVWTTPILETLKTEGVKATFFLLGKNVERHPDIARRIKAEGHTVGLHGHSHTKLHLKGPQFIRRDFDQCETAFLKAGLSHSQIVRFPHGLKNIFAVAEIRRRHYHLCAWGKGVWDSKLPGVDWIIARSLEIQPGEILLLHDGDGVKENPDRSQTAEALPKILQGLKARGYEFVTLAKVESNESA